MLVQYQAESQILITVSKDGERNYLCADFNSLQDAFR